MIIAIIHNYGLTDWNVLKHQIYAVDTSQCDIVFSHQISGEGETK